MSFLWLLVVAGGVRLQRMAAAVERIVSVLVIEDARKADLPLIAMAAELRVQAQTAAVQILQATQADPVLCCAILHLINLMNACVDY